jgi:hypothetical protein
MAFGMASVGLGYLVTEILSHGHVSNGVLVSDYPTVRNSGRTVLLVSACFVQTIVPSIQLLGIASGFIALGMTICMTVKVRQSFFESMSYLFCALTCFFVFVLGLLDGQTALAYALR